ncbi:hypothetical protein PALS2_276 [Staphylococcus phage PALS_2]|nr:hypothetical protein PALS2_276 [Staphylococcus phage PALS_2]
MLNKIKEIRNDRKMKKQRKIEEEIERERIRIKKAEEIERERIQKIKIEEEKKKEEIRKINEKEKELKNKKDNFMKEEGLDKEQFNKDVMSDYQKAKYYLKRNGYSWGHINRMNHNKLFYEANSMISFKAKEKDVSISVSNPYKRKGKARVISDSKDEFVEQIRESMTNPNFYR